MAAASAGCGTIESAFLGTGCEDHNDTTWDLHEPTDPSTTLKIEDCRQDAGACDALCTLELETYAPNGTMTGCNVLFDGTTIHVEVHYDVLNDQPGCLPLQQPTGPLPEEG
jgi:hypothetical protein